LVLNIHLVLAYPGVAVVLERNVLTMMTTMYSLDVVLVLAVELYLCCSCRRCCYYHCGHF
jgi:hypothetical protein